jgi:hypothetical protein
LKKFLKPVLGNSDDNALARSSAVGRSNIQPFSRTDWAALCIVLRTPVLLASVTTRCLRLEISDVPGDRPNVSGLIFCDIAAYNWKQNYTHCTQTGLIQIISFKYLVYNNHKTPLSSIFLRIVDLNWSTISTRLSYC